MTASSASMVPPAPPFEAQAPMAAENIPRKPHVPVIQPADQKPVQQHSQPERVQQENPQQEKAPVGAKQPIDSARGEAAQDAVHESAPDRDKTGAPRKVGEGQPGAPTQQQEADRLMWLSLPGNDQITYYSDTEDEIDDGAGPSTQSNRGNKLYRKSGARWFRKGKLGHWTEARAERESVGRINNRMHSFQHANVEALLDTEASMPDGLGGIYRPHKRLRAQDLKETAEQRDVVYTGLECLNDLLLDSKEYMDRLEEIRQMLADVRRNRSAMWDILRTWALQRDKEDMNASGLYRDRNIRQDLNQNDESRSDNAQDTSSSNRRAKKRSRH
ncbi:hypothetical protein MCUN1_000548 [Malassezia cuniculi]|uniref:Transcriptional regulatory protein RXT2 N-terminal domain-containing protein n=1 Tax=Malassezia cuniculi TaxID=948313 RepID=A0AAF0J512_9BASI|nr:hypothetical protein MCUN1_000548 [Malassezia cuniculi]